MAKKNETRTPTKQSPTNLTTETRVAGVIVLAIFIAILAALAFRLIRWIIGF